MIKRLLKESKVGSLLTVNGWVKSARKHKNITFVNVSDGALNSIQAVIDNSKLDIDSIYTGCSLSLEGTLIESLGNEQKFELSVSKILSIGNCNPLTYPFAKKAHTDEHLRKYLHLRMRTEKIQRNLMASNFLLSYLHDYFQKNDYVHIFTSAITNNSCEGGSEAFVVNSDHLKDGKILVKREDLNELINEVQQVIFHVFDKFASDERYSFKKNESCNFSPFKATPIPIITYSAAISILNSSKKFTQLKFGDTLETVHEQYLCSSHFNGPFFCTFYPATQNPFYMKTMVENEKTVACCFDLIFPKVGELCGGSLREDNYEILKEQLKQNQSLHLLQWYVELRHFGCTSHGGFGIGFERLLQVITETRNIRDVVPFPVARDLLRH